mgnify:FL=1|tara:strand:- start:1398 stop:1841 length:444 start_codon:yes stop_codon:yes gene_type:complete
MKLTNLLIASALAVTVVASPLQAAGEHQGAGHGGMAQAGADKMFLEKRDIDGYTVSFHVMPVAEGMRHGGSHNLMVKVEQGDKVVSELQANSKVVYPDGKEESKPLMKMGDWYMAGYDLQDGGKNQVMVLFKTPDGKKHFGGVNYTK